MADIVEKTCVVTVGATAAFNRLVEATLQPAFLQALSKHEYTKLVIQYGKTGRTFFHNCLRKAGNVDIQIEGFDFKTGDFRETVRVVTAGDGRQEGMMIAHAGTGSLLDGLHFGIPTVLVPNITLADNHQEELAEKFDKNGLCIRGYLESLADVIAEAEAWRDRKTLSNKNYSDKVGPGKAESSSIWTILNQEMGYIDRHLDY